MWGPEAWQSSAVLGNGLASKGLSSVDRCVLTCVCLGVPVVLAGCRAGTSELWPWGWTA